MPDDIRVFGPLISSTDVEEAAEATLRAYIDDYLYMAERVTGRGEGSIARPGSFNLRGEFATWPEDQLPAIVLISTGLAQPPERVGARYHTVYELHVGIAVSAKTGPEPGSAQTAAERLVKLYGAVCTRILTQHPSLGGFAEGIRWFDERHGESNRTPDGAVGLTRDTFHVHVTDVIDTYAGPATPSTSSVPVDPNTGPPLTVTTNVEPVAREEDF